MLRATITAGFDGHLPQPAQDPDDMIKTALAEISQRPTAEHERDVQEELALILCPACRLAVRQQLQAIGRYKGNLE